MLKQNIFIMVLLLQPKLINKRQALLIKQTDTKKTVGFRTLRKTPCMPKLEGGMGAGRLEKDK